MEFFRRKISEVLAYLIKWRRDEVLVFLGFVGGSNVGTAFVIKSLGVDAKYGQAFITAGATLTAAIIAALMVRHQLRENFLNQRKLEKIKYMSNQENRKALMELQSAIEVIRFWFASDVPLHMRAFTNASADALERIPYAMALSPQYGQKIKGALDTFEVIYNVPEARQDVPMDKLAASFREYSKELDKVLNLEEDGEFFGVT